jgi:hypothetical protein
MLIEPSRSLIPAATFLALLWWHNASILTAPRYQDGGGEMVTEKGKRPN